jgi:hypothetical protein
VTQFPLIDKNKYIIYTKKSQKCDFFFNNNTRRDFMEDNKIFWIVGACAIVIIATLAYFHIPKSITNSRLERAAKIARSQDLQTGYCFDDIQDWWKTEICIKREVAQDNMAIGYMAISAGKDKTFNTNDDIAVIKIDLNKSKMIGKWAGSRAKEVAKGLREGIFTKNKFDDVHGKKEVGEPDKPEDKKINWKFWKKDN